LEKLAQRAGENDIMQRILNISVMLVCLVAVQSSVQPSMAAEWGDVTMKFIYDGAVPVPEKIVPTKDIAVCGKHNLVDESLVVNKENKGIAGVVGYIYMRRGAAAPAVHPDYAKTANAKVKLDNSNCRFEPHVVFMRTSQQLVVGNTDPVGHNTNVATFNNAGQNIVIPAAGQIKMNFPVEERVPTKVACNIHPWMSAVLVIRESPYGGVSDKNGVLTFKNVPVGKWTFRLWHERPGYVGHRVAVKFGGKEVKWGRGALTVDVKPGTNDLGEIEIPAAAFKAR
jgi:hypothetical protein